MTSSSKSWTRRRKDYQAQLPWLPVRLSPMPSSTIRKEHSRKARPTSCFSPSGVLSGQNHDTYRRMLMLGKKKQTLWPGTPMAEPSRFGIMFGSSTRYFRYIGRAQSTRASSASSTFTDSGGSVEVPTRTAAIPSFSEVCLG